MHHKLQQSHKIERWFFATGLLHFEHFGAILVFYIYKTKTELPLLGLPTNMWGYPVLCGDCPIGDTLYSVTKWLSIFYL